MGGFQPNLRRWMTFVDGENLTIRGQDLLSEADVVPPDGLYWSKNRFMWEPGLRGTHAINSGTNHLEHTPVRSYYYTSLEGDEDALTGVRGKLWNLGFTPRVFKKDKQTQKSKGVDISLSRDMLSHAFNDHYDVAVLIAGDGDYVPLVEEVKHQGKRVLVVFFSESNGLNPALKLAADDFFDWTHRFIQKWRDTSIQKV